MSLFAKAKGNLRTVEDCLIDSSLPAFRLLDEQYRSTGIGLFLGLGVSCLSGLPDWETLTQRVMSSIPNGAEAFGSLRSAGYSLPAILSWASVHAAHDFSARLRQELYANLDTAFLSLEGDALRDSVRSSNPTLAAVAAFVSRKSKRPGVTANPHIRAIITTNADTLLRYYTRKALRARCLRTIERAAAGPLPGRISVYHLHGMLRFDQKQTLDKEAPDKLIFTDLQYYQAYRELASVFSYTPLFLFRESSFLFIGSRVTDDNIRRLLYWSQRELAESYADEGRSVPEHKRVRHFALVLSGNANEAVEALLRPIGVCPLWYHSHDCLPIILRRLYGDEYGWSELYGNI